MLHPLNFLPLSSVRLNLALQWGNCSSLPVSRAQSCMLGLWAHSEGPPRHFLYKCVCLQFKNLNAQNYISELHLDPCISLISHTLVLGWHVAWWASSTPVQEGWCGSPWVDGAMLYAVICLALGVILMASGLFLSKAISKPERFCLQAFTSHELCILFCVLLFLSLTCSFWSCNVLFCPPIKSDSLMPRAGAQESLFTIYFQHTASVVGFQHITSLVGWLVGFFFQVVFMKESACCRQWYL